MQLAGLLLAPVRLVGDALRLRRSPPITQDQKVTPVEEPLSGLIPPVSQPFKRRNAPPTPHIGSTEDKIIVYGANTDPVSSLVSDVSPAVTKLETWLKMAGLPYEKAIASIPDRPKEKVPYIRHGNNVVADSELIIRYLRRTYSASIKFPEVPEDAHSQAIAKLVQRTLEDHLYYGIGYFRWHFNDAANLEEMCRMGYFKFFPVPDEVRLEVAKGAQAQFYQQSWAQGLCRHSEEEMIEMLRDDLSAISTVLGDKPYLLGDRAYDIDAAMFAFMDAVYNMQLDTPLLTMAREFPNLMQYEARLRKEYWPAV